MFVQVVRAKAKDAAALRRQQDRWVSELAPAANGWLGSTAGVADDGTYVGVHRFESEEAARTNSNRPEQSQFWDETKQLFDGEVTFHDCPDVLELSGGGSDDAGFVQLMIYKTTDPDAVKEMAKEFEDMPDRPDVIGGTSSFAKDGTVIDAIYFTSEKEAREAEKQEMPPEMQATMERMQQVTKDLEYVDLRDPWFFSP